MKNLTTAICLVALLCISCKPESSLEKKLSELDGVIAAKDNFEDSIKEEKTDFLSSYPNAPNDSIRWELSYNMFEKYVRRDSDSSLVYFFKMSSLSSDNPMLECRNKICRALSFVVSGENEKAAQLISTVDIRDVGTTFISRYFLIEEEIFERSGDEQSKLHLLYESIPWQDYLDYSETEYINGEIEYSSYNNDVAMLHYKASYNASSSEYIKSKCACRIADIYGDWGDSALMKYWMAEAAIQNRFGGYRENEPLYNLTLILFKDNEFERTSKKINLMYVTTSALIIMLTIILLLLSHTSKDRTKIKHSGKKLAEANYKLRDSNLIKENFMFNYMQMSVKYLSSMDDYRHKLRKLIKEDGVEALKQQLKSPMESEKSYDEFYQVFDENFLKLYPDFISHVNELLPEDLQFEASQTKLGTQLRILATIRLGLTDSGQIAKFLNCASSSVYSYRSRLKHSALCGSENFEERIKNIN